MHKPQFSLRNLFWAVTLLSLGIAALRYVFTNDPYSPDFSPAASFVAIVLSFGFIGGGIGAPFNRISLGFAGGMIVLLAVTVLMGG